MHALSLLPEVFRPADAFTLLQHPTRLRILEVVRIRGPINFTELADYLQLSNLKLNHHLSLLEEAGLLRFRKTSAAVASPMQREIIFRPIGWARLKKQWEQGSQAL